VDGKAIAGDGAPPGGLRAKELTEVLRSVERPLTLTLGEPSPRRGGGQTVPDGTQLDQGPVPTEGLFRGSKMAVYLQSGKKKHDQWFWLQSKSPAVVCWGKTLHDKQYKSEELVGVVDGPSIKDARALFDEIDVDNSGELDEKELAHLYKKARGQKLGREQMKAAMQEMDTDGGGAVGFEEFATWWGANGGDLEEHRAKALTLVLRDGLELLLVAPTVKIHRYWLRGCASLLTQENRDATRATLQLGAHSPRKRKSGGFAACCSNPSKSAAHGLPAGANFDSPTKSFASPINDRPVADGDARLVSTPKGQQPVEGNATNPSEHMPQPRDESKAESPSAPSDSGQVATPAAAKWHGVEPIEPIERSSAGIRLLLSGWGGESVPRLALQVCGVVVELAVAGPPSSWLNGGFSWRAPFALLMLIVHVGVFISSPSASLQSVVADTKIRSTTAPAEADAYNRAKFSISRTTGRTLACVVLLVGLLAEPVVMEFFTRSAKLHWFNSSNLSQSSEALVYCVRGVIANDYDTGDNNLLMLSWQVHLGLAECFQSSVAELPEYQLIKLLARLLALVQSACLVGWWVCSRYGSAETFSLYTTRVQSRMQLSRKKLVAALEHIKADWEKDENVDSLRSALKDVERCGSEVIAVLGAGSGDSSVTDAPVAHLAEVTAASDASALGWLLLISAGMAFLNYFTKVNAHDGHVVIMEWILRLLVAETTLLAALCMTNARRTLNTCLAELDKTLATAQADIADVQIALDTSQCDETRRLGAQLHANSLQLSPRIRGAQPIRGADATEVGLKLAMLALLGLAVRQAVDILAASLAIAIDDQVKDVASGLATAGSAVAGAMKAIVENVEDLATARSKVGNAAQAILEDVEVAGEV
jgi:hypothetical protein